METRIRITVRRQQEHFPYKEGIYYGTAEGYSGDVSVAVVIQEQINQSNSESQRLRTMRHSSSAQWDVVKNVLKTQSTEVDTVSGATYSSKGILGAIQECIKAGRKSNKWGNHRGEGRYNGTGKGSQVSRSTGA